MNGNFIISLDLELAWGVLDHFKPQDYGDNILAVHSVLPQILNLFSKYSIHATVAYVGFLEFNSLDELKEHCPALIPNYENTNLSPYRDEFSYVKGAEKYYFAPNLISLIKKTPGMELASHTFSHYYCMEKGQNIISFEEDIKSIQTKKNNIESVIFPRNQVNISYLELLVQYGVKSYRGNPKRLFSSTGGILQRLLRLIDIYINITGHNTYPHPVNYELSQPMNIPASRFFKPYSRKLYFLESLKVRRIKKSMTYAAKRGEMFHLWWHPHNFGQNIENNFKILDSILQHYMFLHNKYGFDSVSMKEYRDKLIAGN